MKKSEDNKTYNPEITKEDLKTLGDREQNLRYDGGEDSLLVERDNKVDFAGKELDVPGRTLPKNDSKLKDEENQLYSQGSQSNEHLESTTEHIVKSE